MKHKNQNRKKEQVNFSEGEFLHIYVCFMNEQSDKKLFFRIQLHRLHKRANLPLKAGFTSGDMLSKL